MIKRFYPVILFLLAATFMTYGCSSYPHVLLASCPEDLATGQLGWSQTCCHDWTLVKCAI